MTHLPECEREAATMVVVDGSCPDDVCLDFNDVCVWPSAELGDMCDVCSSAV